MVFGGLDEMSKTRRFTSLMIQLEITPRTSGGQRVTIPACRIVAYFVMLLLNTLLALSKLYPVLLMPVTVSV